MHRHGLQLESVMCNDEHRIVLSGDQTGCPIVYVDWHHEFGAAEVFESAGGDLLDGIGNFGRKGCYLLHRTCNSAGLSYLKELSSGSVTELTQRTKIYLSRAATKIEVSKPWYHSVSLLYIFIISWRGLQKCLRLLIRSGVRRLCHFGTSLRALARGPPRNGSLLILASSIVDDLKTR